MCFSTGLLCPHVPTALWHPPVTSPMGSMSSGQGSILDIVTPCSGLMCLPMGSLTSPRIDKTLSFLHPWLKENPSQTHLWNEDSPNHRQDITKDPQSQRVSVPIFAGRSCSGLVFCTSLSPQAPIQFICHRPFNWAEGYMRPPQTDQDGVL